MNVWTQSKICAEAEAEWQRKNGFTSEDELRAKAHAEKAPRNRWKKPADTKSIFKPAPKKRVQVNRKRKPAADPQGLAGRIREFLSGHYPAYFTVDALVEKLQVNYRQVHCAMWNLKCARQITFAQAPRTGTEGRGRPHLIYQAKIKPLIRPAHVPDIGGCPSDCGHCNDEHVAFDIGVYDGEHDIKIPPDECRDKTPYSQKLRRAWEAGFRVGELNKTND